MIEIVSFLNKNKKTISTMESASGGYLASSITNVNGSSLVFKFGAITYSNDFKMKMGVLEETIQKYSVYSIETAKEMSIKISEFTASDYGVGVTGKINAIDPNNNFGDDSTIFLSIYDRINQEYHTKTILAKNISREENKKNITSEFVRLFKESIIKE